MTTAADDDGGTCTFWHNRQRRRSMCLWCFSVCGRVDANVMVLCCRYGISVGPPLATCKEDVVVYLSGLQQVPDLLRLIGSTPAAVTSQLMSEQNTWAAWPSIVTDDNHLKSSACSVGELVKPLLGSVSAGDVAAAGDSVASLVSEYSSAFTAADTAAERALVDNFNALPCFHCDQHYLVLSGQLQGFYKLGDPLEVKAEGDGDGSTASRSEVPRNPPDGAFDMGWIVIDKPPVGLGDKVVPQDISLGMLLSLSPALMYSCYVPEQLPDLVGVAGVSAAYSPQAVLPGPGVKYTGRRLFAVPVVAAVAHAALGMFRELRKAPLVFDSLAAAAIEGCIGYGFEEADVEYCAKVMLGGGSQQQSPSAPSQLETAQHSDSQPPRRKRLPRTGGAAGRSGHGGGSGGRGSSSGDCHIGVPTMQTTTSMVVMMMIMMMMTAAIHLLASGVAGPRQAAPLLVRRLPLQQLVTQYVVGRSALAGRCPRWMRL